MTHRFPSGVGHGAMRARLESPRASYATPGFRIGTTRAPRRRQLPTKRCHAALLFGATRAYQPDSSSKPLHRQPRAGVLGKSLRHHHRSRDRGRRHKPRDGRLRGPQIHAQLELRRLLDRDVRRLRAAKDPVHEHGRAFEEARKVRRVRQQAAGVDEGRRAADRRQAVLQRGSGAVTPIASTPRPAVCAAPRVFAKVGFAPGFVSCQRMTTRRTWGSASLRICTSLSASSAI